MSFKEEIENISRGEWLGKRIVYSDSIPSTNDEAKSLAKEGAQHGTIVVADEQTGGKGRMGKGFYCPPGVGLWFSYILRPDIAPADASMLTIVKGLAVREVLAECCGETNQVSIKWPNDIVCDGRKLCGILTEMSATADRIEYVVIGTGINVLNEGFKDDLKELAVSVGMLSEKVPERARILEKINAAFEKRYEIFLRTHDLRSLKDEYNSFMAGRDEEIRASGKKGELRGKARGIDDRGRLIVETADEKRLLESGEISIRGIYGIH